MFWSLLLELSAGQGRERGCGAHLALLITLPWPHTKILPGLLGAVLKKIFNDLLTLVKAQYDFTQDYHHRYSTTTMESRSWGGRLGSIPNTRKAGGSV